MRLIYLFLFLLLNCDAIRVSKYDCVMANFAYQNCLRSSAKNCEISGHCDIASTDDTMEPANLSRTDQALWEASHHHHTQ